MLKEFLEEYNLPEFPKENTRQECLKLMQEHVYGFLPEKTESVSFRDVWKPGFCFCAGNAEHKKVEISVKLANGNEFSFPVYVSVPVGQEGRKYPFFVMANFRPDVPDRYLPVEEIIDGGCAVLSFDYNDVTKDNGDFTDGVAKAFFPDGRKNKNDAGKIMMWAWAAMRIMDYAEKELSDVLDFERAGVVGHSRLGKTALVATALDERFKYCFSNNSGCGGAALERNHHDHDEKRENRAERIADMTAVFDYWFCENYLQYRNNENAMPCDQHFFAGCIFPRHLYIASAAEDYWADPTNEFMCAYAAGKYYDSQGVRGFVCPDRLPGNDDVFAQGNVAYHIRPGKHYISRTDWNRYMNYLCSKE
ncbi:MAG: hypothetical protein IJW06_04680 [Clostridia bacterium]|nr:hypothetical protein [Clostridia bacterium]